MFSCCFFVFSKNHPCLQFQYKFLSQQHPLMINYPQQFIPFHDNVIFKTMSKNNFLHLRNLININFFHFYILSSTDQNHRNSFCLLRKTKKDEKQSLLNILAENFPIDQIFHQPTNKDFMIPFCSEEKNSRTGTKDTENITWYMTMRFINYKYNVDVYECNSQSSLTEKDSSFSSPSPPPSSPSTNNHILPKDQE